MVGIISYGSLVDPDSIAEQFGEDVHTEQGWLNGYRRHYGQQSEWRTDDSGNHGNVLTVTEDSAYRCNVVLITGVGAEKIDAYRERETGYEIRTVGQSAVSPFNHAFDDSRPTDYLLPVGEWPLDEWRPLLKYIDHCEQGAKAQGEAFHTAFCQTTFRLSGDHRKPHATSSYN